MRKAASVFVVLTIFAGCDLLGGLVGPDMELSTDSEKYVAPATIELRLKNGSSQTLEFNLYRASLEMSKGGEWRPAPAPYNGSGPWPDILMTLDAGHSMTHPWELHDDLPAGTYRFEITVTGRRSKDDETVRSNSFEIR